MIMKQIDDCLNRFFTQQKPLKKKWQAVKQNETLVYLFHYQHLVLVYDCIEAKVIYEWWEKQADKRGLDSAKEWFLSNEDIINTYVEKQK